MKTASRGDWRVTAAIALLAACYFLYPNARLDFSVFDQYDAAAYQALSEALIKGYGYTRSLDPRHYVPHTTWPPGMPILLMPLTLLSGLPIDLLTLKLGMIVYGVLGIVLAHVYARRLGARPLTSLCVPLFLGLNPYYWQFSRMTDSEMPTIVWSLLALILTDVVWSKSSIRRSTAFGSGLICGLGMLIRGSFFGAVFLPLAYIGALRPASYGRQGMVARYLCSAAGFCVPFLGWLLRNRFIDTSQVAGDGVSQVAMYFRVNPLDPTSPFRSPAEMFSDMLVNLKWHVIYEIPKSIVPGLWDQAPWNYAAHFAPALAVAISLSILAFSFLSIRNLPAIVLYATMAGLNIVYAFGGMDRLWVPVTCLVAVTLPIAAESLSLVRGWAAGALAALTIAAMVASLAFYAVQFERHPYRDADYAALASLFGTIRAHHPYDGNFLTPRQDAFALYTDLPAPRSYPGIGVDPRYRYVILPSAEWNPEDLPGKLLLQNDVWSLIELRDPQRLSEFKERFTAWRW